MLILVNFCRLSVYQCESEKFLEECTLREVSILFVGLPPETPPDYFSEEPKQINNQKPFLFLVGNRKKSGQFEIQAYLVYCVSQILQFLQIEGF